LKVGGAHAAASIAHGATGPRIHETLLHRAFWLGSWSFWAWLGVGLYRELPREMSPDLAALRLGGSERAAGFLGGNNLASAR
jgi:hypothetical protein